MAEPAIVVEDLHKNFGALEVLKGISLQEPLRRHRYGGSSRGSLEDYES